MRGTRIRWNGALRALGIGLAAIAALVGLPKLLAEEPPPPPDDVGLAPPPPAPAPAPPPPPAKPAEPRERERPLKRRSGAGKRARDGGWKPKRGSTEAAPTPGASAAVTAQWTYAPPPVRENFGFER